jgi:hypothetical protein
MHPKDAKQVKRAIAIVQRRVTRMRARLDHVRGTKGMSACAVWHHAKSMEGFNRAHRLKMQSDTLASDL